MLLATGCAFLAVTADVTGNLWLQDTDRSLDDDISRSGLSGQLLDLQHATLVAAQPASDVGQTDTLGVVSNTAVGQIVSCRRSAGRQWCLSR